MEDKLHLEDFLPFQLSRLSNTVSAGIAATYQPSHQLSVTQWRVIAILGRYAEISAREVAEKGALDKVAVSRAVNRLVDAGLIVRHMAEDDRRRSVLALSQQGEAIYDEITPAAIEYENNLLKSLEPHDRQQLARLLDLLWAQANSMG